MPLLKKQNGWKLDKAPVPEYLRDNEEVFHCVMTNEIFREYDDFAERTILCNSMVWTCAMTGSMNLTYEEALQSEKNAQKLFDEFPAALRATVLFIANMTQHTAFGELVDDVYLYIKDRYFVGEPVHAWFAGIKHEYQVKSVIVPSPEEMERIRKKRPNVPETALYKYNLVKYDKHDRDISEEMVADVSKICRFKSYYTRDKNKLFLKQYMQPNANGILAVKESAMEQFGLKNMTLDQIWAGPEPVFVKKEAAKPKKIKQATLANFLKKNNLATTVKTKADKPPKAAKESINMAEMNLLLRQFRRLRDDLTLEDQKRLPVGKPLKARKVPAKYMGDMLAIVDFLYTFRENFYSRKRFFQPIDLDLLEVALLDKTVGGTMDRFLTMLLDHVFCFQEEEMRDHMVTYEPIDSKDLTISPKLTTSESVNVATNLHQWLDDHLGNALCHLPFNVFTTTELLRLHLLSSGGKCQETTTTKQRSANRGGWTNEDDPAVHFRISNPHIIRLLGSQNFINLSIGDKLKVIHCLINQLLTFREFRDAMYEQSEKRFEARVHQRNYLKMKSNKKRKNVEEDSKEDVEMDETRNKLAPNIIRLGFDRAYRIYYILESVPGLFIVHDDPSHGHCLDELTVQVPQLINIDSAGLLKYLRETGDDMNSSDKENDPKEKTEPKIIVENGHTDEPVAKLKVENGHTDESELTDLYMCSTDMHSCIVHSSNHKHHKWTHIVDKNGLDELIESLNKRGHRESDLCNQLKYSYDYIVSTMEMTHTHPTKGKTWVEFIEPNLDYEEDFACGDVEATEFTEYLIRMNKDLVKKRLGGITDADALPAWETELRNFDFSNMTDKIEKPFVDSEKEVEEEKEYSDPGAYTTTCVNDIESEDSDDAGDDVVAEQSSEERKQINKLATILAQLAYSMNPEYIYAPLGTYQRSKKFHRNNILRSWERSLLNATSYSQLFLHFSILDASIRWRKVTTECVVCGTNKNAKLLAVCCRCDKPHHIYCLKPKLKKMPGKRPWTCPECVNVKKVEDRIKIKTTDSASEEESESTSDDIVLCVVCDGPETEEMAQCSECTDSYHLDCASLRRAPRSTWACNNCKPSEKQSNDLNKTWDNTSSTQRRSNRVRDEQDNPLHNVALHDLLVNVMKHEDSWPFVTPVSKKEVPDYYRVITKPMDFGMIKYKLNMGEYKYDSEFMSDAWLIFENSNTYNKSDDEVYKCGLTLLNFFVEYANKLNIEVPSEFCSDEEAPAKKRRRTK